MEKKEQRNIIESLIAYLMWDWCREEAQLVFGESLGNHLWNKWDDTKLNSNGEEVSEPDVLGWYLGLDGGNRDRLIERATEVRTGMSPTGVEIRRFHNKDNFTIRP
jgi:hypothetical protein